MLESCATSAADISESSVAEMGAPEVISSEETALNGRELPSDAAADAALAAAHVSAQKNLATRRSRWRRWLSWMGVIVIGLAAVGSGMVSAKLRDHADERRQLIDELTQLEVLATAHSMTVWKALTLLMAEDKMGFIRLRGEAGKERQALGEQLARVKELDAAGDEINGMLGFAPEESVASRVEEAGQSFTAGVRGALGQMNLSPERVRKRLRYWDFNFEPFVEALSATKAQQEEIAVECASVARKVTSLASFARLLASVMLALSLSRFRREVAAAQRAAAAPEPLAASG